MYYTNEFIIGILIIDHFNSTSLRKDSGKGLPVLRFSSSILILVDLLDKI